MSNREETLKKTLDEIKGKLPRLTNNDEWNGFLQGVYLARAGWFNHGETDPRRDIEAECGYPRHIGTQQYRYMYDRMGIATRVVNIYPDECWAVDPKVYETEEAKDTPFEQDWNDLCDQGDINPLHYLHRADVLSGIGRFGVLLMGFDDGKTLDQPLDGIDERGQPTGKPPGYKLLYLRPFDESMAVVVSHQSDPANPRFGQPLFYDLLFSDLTIGGNQAPLATSVDMTLRRVHWSRVQHIADNLESSPIYGVPRQQCVFDRLCDVRKVLGGSAEMFWKGGFPGYSFELDPQLATAGVTLDQASLQQQFDSYSNGLQRFMALVGLQTKSLAPQVANPDPTLKVQLESIAISIRVPLRIFTGSEQAQLASGQDVRTWNRRLIRRNTKYLTPKMIRAFVDRMVAFGVIRPPKDNRYKVLWPDINMPDEDDRSKIADRQTSAMMRYIAGGAYQLIAPMEFLTMVMGFTQDQAKVIIAALSTSKVQITPPAVTAAFVKGGEAATTSADAQTGAPLPDNTQTGQPARQTMADMRLPNSHD